jgi:hypothetical protein
MAQLAISKRSRSRRSREQWRQVVAAHDESGLSVGSYCERERVSAASFYRWRALVGGDVARVAAAPRPKAREAQFVDLGMMNSLPPTTDRDSATRCAERLELRLELGAGIVLTVSHG